MQIPRTWGWGVIAALTTFHLQAEWNKPTRTVTFALDELATSRNVAAGMYPPLAGTVTYSGWAWVGPDGRTYHFPGTSSAYLGLDHARQLQLPTLGHSAQKLQALGPKNLVNVQASDGSEVYLTTTNGDIATITAKGHMMPKYKVLSVIYAPPGISGLVNYGKSSGYGASTSIINTTSTQGNVFANFGTDSSGFTLGAGWTSSRSSEHSTAVTTTGKVDRSWRSAAPGINHDEDQVEIWLNPALELTFKSDGTSTWNLANNPADPLTAAVGADIVYLSIAQLMGRAPISDHLAARLRREWTPLGSLTGPGEGTDFMTIAQLNPYFAAGSDIDKCSIAPDLSRFTPAMCPTINYAPASGTTIMSTSYSVSSGAVESKAETVSRSYSVQASARFTLGDTFGFGGSGSITWTDSRTESTSMTTGTNAEVFVTQPTSDWRGPSGIIVYTDKIYGTFLFAYPR